MSTMSALLPAAVTGDTAAAVSTGETVLFWVLAPIMVVAALALVFARKAMYAAMGVVLVMISLAFIYAVQEAPFLAVAQVVVYTGAIMMMYLFVVMLVGVDASDSLVETIRGQRWVAGLAGVALVLLLVGVAVSAGEAPPPQGLAEANADTNPVGVARLIFSEHVLAMELAAALLITAAVGALLYTHRERLTKPIGQRATLERRMQGYAAGRAEPTPLPAPGVYARSNAADLPALSGTGEPIDSSVPRVLRIRGQQRRVGEVSPETVAALMETREGTGPGVHGPEATRSVGQSGQAQMPGEAPPPTPSSASTDVRTRQEEDR